MSDNHNSELLQVAREQLKMLRFLALREIQKTLEETLKSDAHRLVYENSTGGSLREVAAASGVSHVTVQSLWEKWAPTGIVTEIPGQRGRYERLASLRAAGLDVPPTPKAQTIDKSG